MRPPNDVELPAAPTYTRDIPHAETHGHCRGWATSQFSRPSFPAGRNVADKAHVQGRTGVGQQQPLGVPPFADFPGQPQGLPEVQDFGQAGRDLTIDTVAASGTKG